MSSESNSDSFAELEAELGRLTREGTSLSTLTYAEVCEIIAGIERFLERNAWRFTSEQLAELKLRLLTLRYLLIGIDYQRGRELFEEGV